MVNQLCFKEQEEMDQFHFFIKKFYRAYIALNKMGKKLSQLEKVLAQIQTLK